MMASNKVKMRLIVFFVVYILNMNMEEKIPAKHLINDYIVLAYTKKFDKNYDQRPADHSSRHKFVNTLQFVC